VGAADFEFYGRSGDAISLDFGSLPGVASGASFTAPTLGFGSAHALLSSSQLNQGSFASDGRLWLFSNPVAAGDADAAARGYQGRVEGSVRINGATKTFAVNVVPGYTGAGEGAVGQSFEGRNRSSNNELFVAQQQQRLRYFGFRSNSGQALPVVDGDFGVNTESALKTFQAAFLSGTGSRVNYTQAGADGVVGPNTAGWLNAANAPTWDELIDPDPQPYPPIFSVSRMVGDYDLLPSFDSDGSGRTGRTPQVERWGTDWAINLFQQGSALAKQRTGVTQLMNGMSTLDGYDSAAYHASHRAGMDIDIHTDYGAQGSEGGSINAAEQRMIDIAIAFIDAGLAGDEHTGTIARVLTSNNDIVQAVRAARPGVTITHDGGSGHETHLHLDVTAPSRVAGVANLAGDLNLDGVVDAADYTVWRDMDGSVYDAVDYAAWSFAFGQSRDPNGQAITVPEPAAAAIAPFAWLVASRRRR
ncbi:MAG: peptidoglycan-binding domain-containing protein, partial [Planctomycetota bacterium]